MTTAEIVPVQDVSALEALDPAAREIAVTQYLTDARDRLAFALQATGPEAVAAIKAEIATAAEATKQLGLSKEIQSDAQEMVRRAEYALGKAIRAGQERGEILKRQDGGGPRSDYMRGDQVIHVDRNADDTSISSPVSPSAFAPKHELSRSDGSGIYDLVDGVTEPEFEAALTDARAEGNLSRANVVRKIKGEQPKPSGERHELLRRTRRVKSNELVAGTVEAVAIPASLLDLIDFSELNREDLGEWISSLSESIKTLRALRSRLEKELNCGQV